VVGDQPPGDRSDADRMKPDLPAAGDDGRKQGGGLGGQQDQNRSIRGFFQGFQQGVARRRPHRVGALDDHKPRAGLHRLQRQGFDQRSDLVDSNRAPVGLNAKDVGVKLLFDFAARPAGATRLQPGSAALCSGLPTVGSHGKDSGRAVFADPFNSGEQQGVRDGLFLKKGSEDPGGPLLIGDRLGSQRHFIAGRQRGHAILCRI
jgi:hypothetical protein